ncbi:MAG TPA: aminopeptidase, partial [Tepidisphaeraceae bacterium]|nr:aminopeptidase [Tepidisphaeraceae bacterium]
MTDPRIRKLADLLINYSCALKPGEKVLVEAIDVPHAFTRALVERAAAAGGQALVLLKSNEINRALMLNGSDASWNTAADVERLQMESVQCYIGARGSANVSELSDVPADKQKIYESTVWKRVHHDVRIKKT